MATFEKNKKINERKEKYERIITKYKQWNI